MCAFVKAFLHFPDRWGCACGQKRDNTTRVYSERQESIFKASCSDKSQSNFTDTHPLWPNRSWLALRWRHGGYRRSKRCLVARNQSSRRQSPPTLKRLVWDCEIFCQGCEEWQSLATHSAWFIWSWLDSKTWRNGSYWLWGSLWILAASYFGKIRCRTRIAIHGNNWLLWPK